MYFCDNIHLSIYWLISSLLFILFILFFFKQKTAYEMRISDWSSDVCSSDLARAQGHAAVAACGSAGIGKRTARQHNVRRIAARRADAAGETTVDQRVHRQRSAPARGHTHITIATVRQRPRDRNTGE